MAFEAAENVYGDEQRAADKAQTIRTQNFDFYLPKPDSQKKSDILINSRAQKIVFLSHGVPLLFWKVGPKDQEIELLSRDSGVLRSFFPHYNKEGLPDPLGANKKNPKPHYNLVFPIIHLTDGYVPEGHSDFVNTPKVKFWRCSDARANEILSTRISLLKEIYRKAEATVIADPSKKPEWLAKGYIPYADLENKIANKTWFEIEAMPDIPKEMKQKASLVGKMVRTEDGSEEFAYNTYTVSRTGTGSATKYSLDTPSLTFYNWDAKKTVESKINKGQFTEVDEYKRPDYRGCYGKVIPGSLADQLFYGGHPVINTEVERPNLYKPGEAEALAIFVYANIAKSWYTPYEGYTSSSPKTSGESMNSAPAAKSVEVRDDDLF